MVKGKKQTQKQRNSSSQSKQTKHSNTTTLTPETLQTILIPKLDVGCDVSIDRVSNEKQLAQLWAGYGSVNSFTCYLSNGEEVLLVIKRVNPPLASSISHDRKLRSYHIEASFYEEVSPIIKTIVTEVNVKCAIPYPYLIESAEIEDDESESNGRQNPSFQFLLSDLRSQFPDECYSIDERRTMTALRWLASFHAIFWEHEAILSNQTEGRADEELKGPKLWEHGGYWHLDTRLEEWGDIDSSWLMLKNCAFAIDERMKADGKTMKTLVHGDFKAANVMFNVEGTDCGVVDFQYCGTGYGMKDVVMFIVSSMSSKTLQSLGVKGLLEAYYKELKRNLTRIGRVSEDRINAVTISVLESQYKLALLDYVRFMAGWGFWGSNCRYAQDEVRTLLDEIAKKEHEALSPHTLSCEQWRSAIKNYFPSLY